MQICTEKASVHGQSIEVESVNEFDWTLIGRAACQTRKRGNKGNSTKHKYKDLVTAFDIETSRLKDVEQSIMYIWQWQIEGHTIVGRTWSEFEYAVQCIREQLKDGEKLVVFVHNLSYEFQFLRGIYDFGVDDVFAVKSRKVLKCEMYGQLEFRCSYLHSNSSLDDYLRDMGVEHLKQHGYDYDKVRYPWTQLTDEEMLYCINDVRGLVEAIHKEMEFDGDNLYTFPLTSTGYVRRDAKRAMRLVSKHYVQRQLPDITIYKALREAFRGGNTHANRYYTDIVLHDVHSADRSSSYPDVQCNCLFPVTPFTRDDNTSFANVVDLIQRRKKAVLCRICLHDVRLSDDMWGCPYIPRDKCRNICNPRIDNGRVLSADYLEITVTDIDLRIILTEYDFTDAAVRDCWWANYGKLPAPLVQETIRYYKAKTGLKNVPGKEMNYRRSKAKLNSIYGMMAQDPVKQDIQFLHGEFVEAADPPEQLLEKSNRKAFLTYQWGVWVTAWARWRLEEGIRWVTDHGGEFVYCDTDSVKYLGEVSWSRYNKLRQVDSIRSGAHATDPSGQEHYMGVYEWEGTYQDFATMGAKKYVSQLPGKPLECTIAGVNKKLGGEELRKHGGIQAFKSGFTFRDAGGTEAVYNDFPVISCYHAEGRVIPITANMVIRPSEYTLGLAAEYERLLTEIKIEY